MRRPALLLALVLLAAWPPVASAATPKDVARALKQDPVFAEDGADPGLSQEEAGKIRVRIAERDPGRIKVAVVREAAAREAGGVQGFANAVDRDFDVRGVLLVPAGDSIHLVVSYPSVDRTVQVLQQAVDEKEDDGLGEQLLEGVTRMADVDPGPAADGAGEGGGIVDPELGNEARKFLGVVKIVLLLVAIAIAAPFVLGALWIGLRIRRRRQEELESLAEDRKAASDELVALGDQITALDLDESMPNADPDGRAAYELALEAYERADTAMQGRPTRPSLSRAAAALREGRAHMDKARRLLEAQATR